MKLRALYDYYKSSKRETDKIREEDLRDEEDKGFLSTATPVHEDCKSKSKELKEDGVIGQEKRHELTTQEYTKETEENLQTEERAEHIRTVRLNHETHKECREGLKNEEGKELLVAATLVHEKW